VLALLCCGDGADSATPSTHLFNHFYTTDPNEKAALETEAGWTYESIAAWIISPGVEMTGAMDLHRMYNEEYFDHFYTTDEGEIATAASGGYVYEHTLGTVFPSLESARWMTNSEGTLVPLFRLWHEEGLDHFYTTGVDELAEATSNGGYTYEFEAAYVFPSEEAALAADPSMEGHVLPLYRLFAQ